MEKISVFLNDWQVLFREGIHFTLSGEEDIEVIGETTSSEEALSFIQNNPPRVAVLNINHDKFSGIKVARYLTHNYPSVAVLLIMDRDNEEHLFMVLKSGASACITKDADPDDLINSIRLVAQGNRPICKAILRPEIATRVLGEFEESLLLSQQVDNLLASLTHDETQILHRIAEGEVIEQICQVLNISEEAINQNLGYIMTKLVTNNHIREVIEAAQNGLLSLIFRAHLTGKTPSDYVTRGEFTAFKDTIRDRFKTVAGEIV